MAARFWGTLSQTLGLQYENKSLYGRLGGFYLSLSSVVGALFRLQVYLPGLSAAQPDMDTLQKAALLRAEAIRITEEALREYKLVRRSAQSGEQFIAVEFSRTARAVKQMDTFLQTVTSGLARLGLPETKICKHCGKTIETGEVPVKIGFDVFPMHDSCAETILRQSESSAETKPGSVIAGMAGALLAAIVASLPWAAVFALGYMASIVGLLIGFVVSKGYDLFRGRQGRAKIVIVVLCVLLSVALGQFLGSSYTIAKSYDEVEAGLTLYEEMTMTRNEFIFWAWSNAILTDADAKREVMTNFGMGVFFALLGCSGMFIGIYKDTASQKPKRLMAR